MSKLKCDRKISKQGFVINTGSCCPKFTPTIYIIRIKDNIWSLERKSWEKDFSFTLVPFVKHARHVGKNDKLFHVNIQSEAFSSIKMYRLLRRVFVLRKKLENINARFAYKKACIWTYFLECDRILHKYICY